MCWPRRLYARSCACNSRQHGLYARGRCLRARHYNENLCDESIIMHNPFPPTILYGADYNPEQWPESVWLEDMHLMKLAHVNMATINVFSWALLEPAPDQYTFGQLDRVMDMLAEH